jgi:hypothetical protein
MKTQLQVAVLVGVLVGGFGSGAAWAQGMSPEARKNIHLLFSQHESVRRTVTMTKEGYLALTESDQPQVAAALKAHVRQMEERFRQGLMVRRHDPAFVEFAAHYDDLTHLVEPTDKGLRVTVTGKTPAAIKVAQNHANVVTDFATNGWEAHDRDHAAVLRSATPTTQESSKPAKQAALPCCSQGGECQRGGAARSQTASPDSKPTGATAPH